MNTQTFNESFKQFANNITVTGPGISGHRAQGDSIQGAALYLGSNPDDPYYTLSPALTNLAAQNQVTELADLIIWVNGPSYFPGGGNTTIDFSLSELYYGITSMINNVGIANFNTSQDVYIGFIPMDIVVNGQFAKMIVCGSYPLYINQGINTVPA